MQRTIICKTMHCDTGHRVYKHEGKCAHLHGHRYGFTVALAAEKLDMLGRVFDFGWVKRDVGGWLDRHWDHALILNESDPLVFVEALDRIYMLPYNPTAENLAKFLLKTIGDLRASWGWPPELEVVYVECEETPSCSATVFAEGA